MFEILVYLFENYAHVEACPAPEQLARKLSAAGFEEEDISAALEWLSGLEAISEALPARIEPQQSSFRCYAAEETARLGPECRGFITFLESAGVVNAATREMIIERAMALPETKLSLAKFKVIVLMVLWSRHETMDTLILEELLAGDDETRLH